jgi:hypothetical protein
MNQHDPIGERDRDRALGMLRWLTAVTGIGSLVVAAIGTSAAARASTPSPTVRGHAAIKPAPGSLSAEQLAALEFALPKPTTIVIWATPGQSATGGRAAAPPPTPGGHAAAPMPTPGAPPAPAATAPPRPAPTPPPPPVATTGTS